MATVRFSINIGDSLEQVVVATGAATVTKSIELTIDQAALIVDGNSAVSPRAIKRGEIVIALQVLLEALQRDNLPLNI